MKIILISLIIFLFSIDSAFSQDSLKQQQIGLIIKTDIVYPLICSLFSMRAINFSIEKTITKKHSIQFSIIKIWYDGKYSNKNIVHFLPTYKYYLNQNSNNDGIFTGLYLRYSMVNIKYLEYTYNNDSLISTSLLQQNNMHFGSFVGFQKYFKQRISFDFLFGFGIGKTVKYKLIQKNPIVEHIDKLSLDYIIAINIGYKF